MSLLQLSNDFRVFCDLGPFSAIKRNLRRFMHQASGCRKLLPKMRGKDPPDLEKWYTVGQKCEAKATAGAEAAGGIFPPLESAYMVPFMK